MGNIPRNAGETRYRRETLASKVASSPERGRETAARGKRINATRYTEEGNPGNAFANQSSSPGARISSKESSVFPSRPPIPRFLSHPHSSPSLFSHLPLLRLFGPPPRGIRDPHFLFPPPRPYNPTVGSRLLAGRGKMGKEEEGRENGNAVTRENPLRNVFGPCTAQYHLQSRACVKCTCKKRKRGGGGGRGGIIDVQSREFRKYSLCRKCTTKAA